MASDTPVLSLLETMTQASIDANDLDHRTLLLVRLAALVATDAPPASYAFNLAAADDVGVDAETARDVLLAVAPIVGTSRIATAIGNVSRALGVGEDAL